jgi:hypothetical protein
MGFIPIFLTMGSALILFFLTVKNTLQRKINLQKELLFRLKELNPELGSNLGEKENPEDLIEVIREGNLNNGLATEAVGLVKEMKINRHQYNLLVAKAPYKWVAKLANYHSI